MMGFIHLLILCGAIAVLKQTDAQSFTCSVGSGEACPVAFCPGDEVTYTCDATGTVAGNTLWILPDETCASSAIVLPQFGSVCSTTKGDCGPFSAANSESCLVSTLTFIAAIELNNTLINCTDSSSSGESELGSSVLHITVPPPPPTGVSVASCTGDSVTLVWEEPIDTDSPVTSYELLATPTVENCPLNSCSAPSTQYSLTGLDRGRQYAVSVRADACDGALEGSFSSSLGFTLDVVLVIENVVLVYDSENVLKSIDVTWSPLDVAANVIGSSPVECQAMDQQYNYTLTLTSDTGTSTNKTAQCCSASFTISTDSVSSYSVQVSGAGVSSPVMAGISTTNDQLSVQVESTCTSAIATCSFLSGFTGSAYCRVDYGTMQNPIEYNDISQKMGSAGESVTVELTEASGFSTTYTYQAAPSGDTPLVRMEGMFTTVNGEGCVMTTNCLESDLFEGGNDTNPSVCHMGEMTGEILNGTLSCTGLTPGSTATFTCNMGYELSGGNGELVCQDDGTWSRPTPTCVEGGNGGSNSTPVIIGVVITVVILLVIAVLVGLLLLFYFMKKKQKKSDKHSGPLVQVQVNEQNFVAKDSPIDPGTRVSGVVGAMGTIDRKEQQPTSRMSSTFESSHRDPETGEATNGESHHQHSGSKIKKGGGKKRTSRVTSDSSTAELQKSMPEEVLYADLSHEGRRPAPPPPAEEPVVYSEVKTSTSAM